MLKVFLLFAFAVGFSTQSVLDISTCDVDYTGPRYTTYGIIKCQDKHFPDTTEVTIKSNLAENVTVKSFTCKNCTLSGIPKNIFTEFPQLGALNLENCQIEHIQESDFTGSQTLVDLSLNHNKIKKLDNYVFRKLTVLNYLSLTHNELVLDEHTFGDLKALTTLKLSFNLLNTLPHGIFDDLTGLLELYLDHNIFAGTFDLEPLMPLNKLHTIDISYNMISEFDYVRLFENVENFREINLEMNRFTCPYIEEFLKYVKSSGTIVVKTYVDIPITSENLGCSN